MRGILGNKLINGLGVIGICGWGGYALQTAALDTGVKATATEVSVSKTESMIVVIPDLELAGGNEYCWNEK